MHAKLKRSVTISLESIDPLLDPHAELNIMNYLFQVILLLGREVIGHIDHSHHEHDMLPTGLRCKNVERNNNQLDQNLRILNGHETDWNWPFIVRLGMKDEGKVHFLKLNRFYSERCPILEYFLMNYMKLVLYDFVEQLF